MAVSGNVLLLNYLQWNETWEKNFKVKDWSLLQKFHSVVLSPMTVLVEHPFQMAEPGKLPGRQLTK